MCAPTTAVVMGTVEDNDREEFLTIAIYLSTPPISTWVASPCLSSFTCSISGTDLHISEGVTWLSVSVNILEQS